MLDIVASYHCMQFQGKLIIENGGKTSSWSWLTTVGQNSRCHFFFSFKNLVLSVTRYHMGQLSSSTLSGKTNNPILRKRSGRRTDERTGACYEIKKSVGRPFDTSRCCRKWFSISYTKRKLRNCEWPLKLLGKKINTYWESWFSRIGQNVQLSDVHDKYISFILYSIEMNCTFG